MAPENGESRPSDRTADPENTDLIYQSITSAEFLAAVEAGVRQGIVDAFSPVDIADAIVTGVWQSWPYAEELREAVYGAVRESMDGRA